MTEKDAPKSGRELYQIVLAVEELLGGELSGDELAELVNAADPPSEEKRIR
ncbi:hypothetical protein [Arthrobacter sp. B2a2-09]|uniref:hypothetical protein n=1 Tax=Arthrobacter sp. B2a2-09 TaxID=2952822 RepID=UPI0022CDB325|nr:hypothetical protein [Arthrobacter sp. B2a2-09]MCZ9884608.1 hypothetical protein [Arthrobacter sp. B2a2-09]